MSKVFYGMKLKGVKLEFFIVCRGEGISVGVYGKMFLDFEFPTFSLFFFGVTQHSLNTIEDMK